MLSLDKAFIAQTVQEEHHDTLQTGVLQNASPDGVANFMIFGIENHKISSHDDLHINTFNPTD